ncbi:MAG: MarR family transcriptional regulator, partial [Planctomycetota bacterium]
MGPKRQRLDGPKGTETGWIDEFSAAWAREYPAKDTSSLLLLTRLARLSILTEAFQREALEPFNLTPNDYAVLAALRRSGAPYQLSPSKLYTNLERSSGGMTK